MCVNACDRTNRASYNKNMRRQRFKRKKNRYGRAKRKMLLCITQSPISCTHVWATTSTTTTTTRRRKKDLFEYFVSFVHTNSGEDNNSRLHNKHTSAVSLICICKNVCLLQNDRQLYSDTWDTYVCTAMRFSKWNTKKTIFFCVSLYTTWSFLCVPCFSYSLWAGAKRECARATVCLVSVCVYCLIAFSLTHTHTHLFPYRWCCCCFSFIYRYLCFAWAEICMQLHKRRDKEERREKSPQNFERGKTANWWWWRKTKKIYWNKNIRQK